MINLLNKIFLAFVFICLVVFCIHSLRIGWLNMWFTPNQQGQKLLDREEFALAAKTFEDDNLRGVSYFRNGEFKKATNYFTKANTADSAFNRGNAFVFQGKYEDAIQSYQIALQRKPKWFEAEDNIAIAKSRIHEKSTEDTGVGELGADDIKFDEHGKHGRKVDDKDVATDDLSSAEKELRVIWLRRLQTSPNQYLKNKFRNQLQRQEKETNER